MVVGVIWDISWHMTIGRDSFWTPAHMAIYLGGVVGGVASGIVVLRTTFAGSDEARAASVRFWGFRGPLGAWVSIWGAFAMITSAPFDDWWHGAYGLDVEILSPPHMVLALGMVALAMGAMLVTLAVQNRSAEGRERVAGWMYAYAAGCVLSFLAIMVTEYSDRILMHSAIFYRIACGVFPFFLVAAGRASRLRWGTTAVALCYSALRLAMLWILPLFPAEPKLGPIYQHVTHMVPLDFPLLLVVPAIVMDLARQRQRGESDWLLAITQGVAFFAAFLVAQWFFADFLMSPASRNWVFRTDSFPYWVPSSSYSVRNEYVPVDATEHVVRTGLLVAAGLSVGSATLGMAWGRWLRRVQR